MSALRHDTLVRISIPDGVALFNHLPSLWLLSQDWTAWHALREGTTSVDVIEASESASDFRTLRANGWVRIRPLPEGGGFTSV